MARSRPEIWPAEADRCRKQARNGLFFAFRFNYLRNSVVFVLRQCRLAFSLVCMTETNKKQAKAKPAAAIVKAPKAAPAKAAKPDGAALPAGVYSIGADGLSPLFFADLTAVGAIIVDGRGKGSRGACSTRRLAEMLPAGRVVAAPDLTSDDHDRRDAAIADLAKLAGSIAVILVTHEQAPVDDRRYEICDLIAPEFGAPLAPVYHLCGGEVVAHAELRTSIAMDRDYDCESYFSAAQIPAAVRDLLA